MAQFPRLVLAGIKSGVGKSSLATGIMQALTDRGLKVQGFKVGPDYIDPGFHTLASGRRSRNLDLPLLGEKGLQKIFVQQGREVELSLVEGVMGLFDGDQTLEGDGSTASIAKLLKAPVILVVDCSSLAQSVVALVKGYVEYDSAVKIRGLILNQVGSLRHEILLRDALEELGIPILGALAKGSLSLLPEDGAGLSPARRTQVEKRLVESLGQKISQVIDLELLCKLAEAAPPLEVPETLIKQEADQRSYPEVRLGYALDEAFCFYYQDAFDYLKHIGAQLIPFSPLQDKELPKDLDGLVLGGGFLEQYANRISANQSMRESILSFAKTGKPLYAEGTGFEYLTKEYIGIDGVGKPMVGLIPARTIRKSPLVALGYYEGKCLADSVLGAKGAFFKGHQYRRTVVEGIPTSHLALQLGKREGLEEVTGYLQGNIFASHLYQHWVGQPEIPRSFLERCWKAKTS